MHWAWPSDITLVMRCKLTGDSPPPAELAGLVLLPSLHLQCMQTAPGLALQGL